MKAQPSPGQSPTANFSLAGLIASRIAQLALFGAAMPRFVAENAPRDSDAAASVGGTCSDLTYVSIQHRPRFLPQKPNLKRGLRNSIIAV